MDTDGPPIVGVQLRRPLESASIGITASEVVLTDSVPLPAGKRLAKITTLSVAPLIGEAIKRIHRGESVWALFSSEVSFTQEMLLWEDGQERRLDTRREPDKYSRALKVEAPAKRGADEGDADANEGGRP